MSEQEPLHTDIPEAAEPPASEAAASRGKTASWEQLEAAQAEARQFREGWQRERAEFANYKRRVERERAETYQNASSDVIRLLLPIIDDFERAMANIPEALVGDPWVNGVNMIGKKFEHLLAQFSVTLIDPTGQPFDAAQHEAVMMDESDTVASGHVIETLQRGYLTGERVIRPALVRVAR